MSIRSATPDDAAAIQAIYAPIVSATPISFELEPPSVEEMRQRIGQTLTRLPWLVSTSDDGEVEGYVYASRFRERAAYQWAVEVTAYVRSECHRRGVARRLYGALSAELVALGYHQAIATITLPNAASVGLHEAMGFAPAGVLRRIGFKLGAWHDVGWWQKALQPSAASPAAPALRAAHAPGLGR